MKAKGAGLAIIFGKPKKGGSDEEPDPEDSDADEEYDEAPPDFEAFAIEAFPELEEEPKRIEALWKAMRACMKA